MKRIVSCALAFLLLLSLAPAIFLVATAATTSSGTCGDNLTWSLDSNGTLTISGTGEMAEWQTVSTPNPPWFSSRDSIKKVDIEAGVTSITSGSFSLCYNLTSITIPDSVTYIGNEAFKNCDSLIDVYITDVAKWCAISCGGGFFSSPFCYGGNLYLNGELATNLKIPNGVTDIRANAFSGCVSLTGVTIPNSVTNIEASAFEGCKSLTSVTISSGVTSIGTRAFRSCESLASITISNGVTSIGASAFNGCKSLTSITIPNSVTSIGRSAFEGCTLTEITIPYVGCEYNGVKNTSFGAIFCDVNNNAKKANSYVPDTLKKVTITGGNRIDYNAFAECNQIKEIVIIEGIRTINNYAFEDCTSLEHITIPDSVIEIGSGIFGGCDLLTIHCSKKSPAAKLYEYNSIPVKYICNGHEWEETSSERATCEKEGSVIYSCCNCDETKKEVINKTEHTYENACDTDCDVCGEKRDFVVHNPGAAATKTSPQRCTVCGYVISPALGDSGIADSTDGAETTAPTDGAETSAPTDGAGDAEDINTTNKTDKDRENKKDFPWWIVIVAVVVVGGGIAAFIIVKKKKN